MAERDPEEGLDENDPPDRGFDQPDNGRWRGFAKYLQRRKPTAQAPTYLSSDDDSDYTLENSESSDSGIIEHDFDSSASFGINPLFSKHSKDQMSTTSRACKEFVYIPQREEDAKSLLLAGNTVGKTLKSHMVTKTDKQRMTGSGRSQRKIVILNDESAMIVNESCLI